MNAPLHSTLLKMLEAIEQRLKKIEETITEQKSLQLQSIILQKTMLNVTEAAVYLDVSESHIYKLTSQKKIPHYSPGGKRLFFRRIELDNWLMANRLLTKDEIETKASDYIIEKSTKN